MPTKEILDVLKGITEELAAIRQALDKLAWSILPMEERNLIIGMRQLDAHRAKEEAAKAKAGNGEIAP